MRSSCDDGLRLKVSVAGVVFWCPPVEGNNVGTCQVKAILRKLLSSRKLILVGGAALVISVATSAAALLIGKDRLLGRSYGAANGFSCETAQTVNIRKNGTTWIRKYIRMQEVEGVERVKTALRVAALVYAEHQPDLIQITVLDENGPELRSNMRGRAVAAQIVFIADPAAFPDEAGAQRLSAFYHDGAASRDGLFYGLRIDMPFEDVEKLALEQDRFDDCKNPDDQIMVGHQEGPQGQQAVVPMNLGVAVPRANVPTVPADAEHDEDMDGDALMDLLTSTPAKESDSYFSIAYWKGLLFGKGASVAEAAEK